MTTALQARNLNKLADYLDTLPANYQHFDMAIYYGYDKQVAKDEGEPDEVYYIHSITPEDADCKPSSFACGSAACAVGHGPSAGIKPRTDDYTWSDYAFRVFGTKLSTPAGGYMFGPDNPNCHFQAASRIRNFLADPELTVPVI